MATATSNAPSSLQAFHEKVKGQVDQAKAKLDQVQTNAKEKRTEAETAAIAKLNTAKQEIDRKLQDIKTTHQTHVSHAKTEINADVAKFKGSKK